MYRITYHKSFGNECVIEIKSKLRLVLWIIKNIDKLPLVKIYTVW
jgi:hypothetical protein